MLIKRKELLAVFFTIQIFLENSSDITKYYLGQKCLIQKSKKIDNLSYCINVKIFTSNRNVKPIIEDLKKTKCTPENI